MSPLLIPVFAMLIPITAILSKLVFRPWIDLKQRQLEQGAGLAAEKAAQYAARTEQLEARVRVLERIVTDTAAYRGHDLAGEIERLRDAPARLGPPPVN